VGGNSPDVIRYGARCADVVELTGLGRTLPDGHFHEPTWTAASIETRVNVFRSSIPTGRHPRLGALVQHVEVTDDRVGAAEAHRHLLAQAIPPEALPSIEDLLTAPYTLIGTEDEIISQLHAHQARWGISRYTVRTPAIDTVASIIDRLAAHPT
jgi:hypothetical protein